jgi:hypothetical protein
MTEVIQKLLADVGSAFRHVLPGILVLAAAYERKPEWFSSVERDPTSGRLLLLSGVAIALGNLAYAVNRYGVLHILEALLYRLPTPLPRNYAKFVGDEIKRFYRTDTEAGSVERVRQLVRFRDAAAVYLLVAGEAGIFAVCGADGPLNHIRTPVLVIAVSCLISGLWTYVITRLVVRSAL